jgi:glutamate dehydrogenase
MILRTLESGYKNAGQAWEHRLRRLLARAVGSETASSLLLDYLPFLSDAYRALTPPRLAAGDLLMIRRLRLTGTDQFTLRRPEKRHRPERYLLRICSKQERYLDEVLPHLQHLGLRIANHLALALSIDETGIRIDSFTVEPGRPSPLPLHKSAPVLLDALDHVLKGQAESDALNGLIMLTRLSWQAVDVLRTYRNYALQLRPRYTAERFHQALLANPHVAMLLFRFFDARFNPGNGIGDPRQRQEDALAAVCGDLSEALETVADSLEDHILRELFNLIDATLRTNFYRRARSDDYFVSIKLDGLGLLQLPSPKPRYEIYVHSFAMEGIHLRGGKVARGGIRWSERPDDFRMEILGLMRTQMVKNALIVPQGAKGGFVVKKPGASAEQVTAAYKTLIRGLLDLTDNLVDGEPAAPEAVLSYDGSDPYLVVAADKGTAKLSDTANALATEYCFWLHDAFASGGSRGYHHKSLGITARGVWECVRQHFLEMGRNADREPMTVVGIGSMDGDVFGNGMLLSPQLRLMGAFDGRHIFLDPNPPVETAWAERKRLFDLAGSTWNDYQRSLISEGGGVFSRNAKDIPLTPAIRRWLNVRAHAMEGEELIRALLAAPVDLLWLGGIGTYVKASDEAHETIGDRGNDPVRVDGNRVKALVVAEGANLGFTQRGRVEFARNGGRINIDAVDNSAGVDLSDHEVNLKILLRGLIADEQERDRVLAELTTAVCDAVTAHNRAQCLCISRDLKRSATDLESFLEVAHRLENFGELDRRSECFPSDREIYARQPPGLTRPELAILMLYAKLAIKQALLEAGYLLTDPLTAPFYRAYFPSILRERFGNTLYNHRLAAEITATQISNWVIDHEGAGFLARVRDFTSQAITEAVRNYLMEQQPRTLRLTTTHSG